MNSTIKSYSTSCNMVYFLPWLYWLTYNCAQGSNIARNASNDFLAAVIKTYPLIPQTVQFCRKNHCCYIFWFWGNFRVVASSPATFLNRSEQKR